MSSCGFDPCALDLYEMTSILGACPPFVLLVEVNLHSFLRIFEVFVEICDRRESIIDKVLEGNQWVGLWF